MVAAALSATGITLDDLRAPPALDGLTLAVPSGQRVALLGRNGAGKTTLLRIAAGLLAPASGTARVEPPLGYMPQDYRASLLPWLRAGRNVALPLAAAGLDAGEARARVLEAASTVALDARLLERWPYRLSGGEQQLVALARALVGRPRTLLLDEPLSALDLGARLALRRALRDFAAARKTTVLLVSHDLDDVLTVAERALVVAAAPLRVVADLPVDGGARAAIEAALGRA